MTKIYTILCFICTTFMMLTGCDSGNAQPAKTQKMPKNTKGITWMTDFEAAQSRAKINNKPILLAFMGSDWCGWCKKLDKEVFSTPEFQKWAADNVITVLADFPATKKLPPETARQNEKLRDMYNIAGYPTVLLLKYDGTVIAKTGYLPGGPANYIKQLKIFTGASK